MRSIRSNKPIILLLSFILLTVLGAGVWFTRQALQPTEVREDPRLVSVIPNGQTPVGRTTPIEIQFNQHMDQPSVEAALHVTPDFPYTTEWLNEGSGDLLRITPQGSLAWETAYQVTVDAGATNNAGRPLTEPITLAFTTGSEVHVSMITPANGDDEVDPDSAVTIQFDRPVVNIETISDTADLPQPVQIEPAVQGTGRWIAPDTYGFYPTVGLTAGTDYTVRVAQEVAPAMELPTAYESKFITSGPRLTSGFPYDGASEVERATAITLLFNQPMDRDSVEDNFELSTEQDNLPVAGQFVWEDDQTLVFQPSAQLEISTNYQVEVEGGARAQGGARGLNAPYRAIFTTVDFLAIESVQPAPGSAEVTTAPTDTVIAVQFNHPVVPLVGLAEAKDLPTPVTITPRVEGTGEWVTTSLFIFRPSKPLAPSTEYAVTVEQGLQDTVGSFLKEAYSWSFTTEFPRVVRVEPSNSRNFVAANGPIGLRFNQPMDTASTEAAFRLTDEAGSAVAGRFEWQDDNTLLRFFPSAELPREQVYTITLAQGAQGAQGGTSEKTYTAKVTTAPLPEVAESIPAQGETDVNPYSSIQITFNAPMVLEDVEDYITFFPTVTQVYTYYDPETLMLNITAGGPLQPSTDYTVTLGKGIEDESGQPLAQPYVLNFTTAPLPPLLEVINAGSFVGTYNPYTDTIQVVNHRNISRMTFTLTQMSVEALLPLLGTRGYEAFNTFTGDPDNVVAQWDVDVDTKDNVSSLYKTRVPNDGDALGEGIYLLRVSAPETDPFTAAPLQGKIVMVFTPTNLTIKRAPDQILVWATDMQTGEPTADAPIEILNNDGDTIAEGTTDSDGLFRYTLTEEQQSEDPYQPMYAISRSDNDAVNGIVSTEWANGISPYEWNISESLTPKQLYGTIYSDRPIYRPGQTVYFKGVLRQEDGAQLVLPTLSTLKLNINYQGETIESQNVTLSPFGTFTGQFVLDEEAQTGYYELNLQQEELGLCYDDNNCYYESIYGSFQVAEYQRPEFEVSVTTDQPSVVQGDDLNANITARYYFGGNLTNAPYNYRVISNNYYFDVSGLPGFWSWYDDDNLFDLQLSDSRVIDSGQGKLGADGTATLELNSDLERGETPLPSQLLMVETDVRDVNDRVITGRTNVIVHAGEFYIGLQPDTLVGSEGDPFTVTVATADTTGELVGDVEVTLELYQREWFSVREEGENGGSLFTTTFSDTLIATQPAVTGEDGTTSTTFTPDTGGTYTVLATARDSKGNTVRSRTYFWVSSENFVAWERTNDDRMQLIPDKDSYQVGDVAHILIPTPFEGMTALITQEQLTINSVEVRTLAGTSEVLDIPITEEMIPNAVISVVAVTGITDETPMPEIRVGAINLTIAPTEKELTLEVTPLDAAAENPQPGDTVNYEITVTDSEGDPVSAELSLAVVDKAIFALAADGNPTLVDSFYAERPLAVRTASGLIVNVDRLSQNLAPNAKGGGGPGTAGLFGPELVRRNFVDTAYWNGTITTDANGQANVSFTLPDNLTTWVVTARGVTGETTLIGEQRTELLSTKPLLMRPTLPRFFVVGDEATLRLVVSNNTDNTIDGTVTFEAQGLEILDGDATSTVNLPANSTQVVEVRVRLQDVEQVVVTAGVEGGGLNDRVEVPIPVYHLATPEVVATGGVVRSGEGGAVENLQFPQASDPTLGNLTIEVAPSLAGATESSLTWLESYPYANAEWSASTLLPNVATLRALRELGFERDDIEAGLDRNINEAVQKLLSWQKTDGGWGWWQSDDSQSWLTGYALLGLHEAADLGYTVPEERFARATRFIERWLSRTSEQSDDATLDTRAFLLYVLSETGSPDVSRTVALFDQHSLLSVDGKAFLLLALDNAGDEQRAQVQTLATELTAAARLSATGANWEEENPDPFAFDSSIRSTAVVLRALVRVQPEHLLVPQTVRWLMHARNGIGFWETTQDTAWSVLALTDYMVASGELEGDFSYEVAVNDDVLISEQASPDNITTPISMTVRLADLLVNGENRLIVTQQPGGNEQGRLYYNAWLRYYLPAEEVKSRFEGISVARQYESVDPTTLVGTGAMVNSVAAGDVIQVRLTVNAPTDLPFFTLEDPIPAGFEVIDPALLTSSQQGGVSQERIDANRGPFWFDDWSQSVIRDEKVALFSDFLPKGTYEYTYLLRATVPGTFNVMPSIAYQAYQSEVFGRSDSAVVTVEP